MPDIQSIFSHLVLSFSASTATREEAIAATNEKAPPTPRPSGSFLRITSDGVAPGRRPEGLRERDYIGKNPTARYFAKLTELTAASASAYERLRDELAHHGAPTGLLRRLEVARRDELRHARALTKVARKYGARGLVPEVTRHVGIRTLAQISHENAIEGCARESFRTLVTLHQAANAADVDVARIMKKVSTDKTRHADLAWSIQDWLATKLSSAEMSDAESLTRSALFELGSATFDFDSDLAKAAGLPDGSLCVKLLRGLESALFKQDRAA